MVYSIIKDLPTLRVVVQYMIMWPATRKAPIVSKCSIDLPWVTVAVSVWIASNCTITHVEGVCLDLPGPMNAETTSHECHVRLDDVITCYNFGHTKIIHLHHWEFLDIDSPETMRVHIDNDQLWMILRPPMTSECPIIRQRFSKASP